METKRIVVDPKSMVETVLPRELGGEWSHEKGRLIYLKTYNLKPESIAKAKLDGLKNAEHDKVLIVCTDEPGSTHKLILLRNFLGFCQKSGVDAISEDGADFILNPNLEAQFEPNNLKLKPYNKRAKSAEKEDVIIKKVKAPVA